MEQQIIFLAALIFILIVGINIIYLAIMILRAIVSDILWKIDRRRFDKVMEEKLRNKERYKSLKDCDKKADELFK